MKKLSQILNEGIQPGNPGNQISKTGVTNHYTPVQNILTNVKNLFCQLLGIYAEVAEDGFSIKLTSTQFTSEQKTNEILWRSMYNDVFTYGTSSLYGYITAQGLNKVTLINLGGYYVAYFSPNDIKAAEPPINMEIPKEGCPSPCEMKESLYDEFEFTYLTEGDDNADDNSNDNNSSDNKDNNDSNSSTDNDDKIGEILSNEDKVKAAKQLEIVISQKIQLPRDYYFAAIKFKNDDEAIALRWKYEKELPTGKSTETTRSLLHIFGTGDKAIWVQDYAKDSIVQLPDEVKKLIDSVLDILKAKKTNDPAIYSLGSSSSDSNEDSDNKDDDNNDNNSDDNTDNADNKKEDKKNDKDKKDSNSVEAL